MGMKKLNLKRGIILGLVFSMVISISGCSSNNGSVTENNSLTEIVNEQANNSLKEQDVPQKSMEESDVSEINSEKMNADSSIGEIYNNSNNEEDNAEQKEESLQPHDLHDNASVTNEEESSLVETETSTSLPSVEESDESSEMTQGEITAADTEDSDEITEEEVSGLTPTQLNTINMLNYMMALTQSVNEEKGNQLFLESAYNSFDNLYPNSVDTKTQAQITKLMDTIHDYLMLDKKRDRLEFIYEQNKAQALRQALPNPLGLLSAVQSGNIIKAAASVLYMAVDSVNSYSSASSQADLQFIKDGWELDDEESTVLHNSTKDALTYLFEMVRTYDLPGDYALSRESIENFITWSNKPDSQRVRTIEWMESHENTYCKFGPYWLTLVKCYYEDGQYEKCLEAISEYEAIATRIFRLNLDYAEVLPMVIIAAKETMTEEDYITTAEKYCELILLDSKDSDWAIRYFAAQIYMDLYALTNQKDYLDQAYKIAKANVNELVDEQQELNRSYLAPIEEEKIESDDLKRIKEEKKQYNKTIKDERKIALPPVSEALYLNCELLFALAEELNLTIDEKEKIEDIIHENGGNIFLTESLDNRFWFSPKENIIEEDIDISFDGEKLSIPAICITDRSVITVTIIKGTDEITIADWVVNNVERPKDAEVSDFIVTYSSDEGKKFDYSAGDKISIKVIPTSDSEDYYLEFAYNVVATKVAYVFDSVGFERTK